MTVFLDSGIVWNLAYNKESPALIALRNWFDGLLLAGHEIVICEINDYEVRRELLRKPAERDLRILDELIRTNTYAPITTSIIRRAASLWAETRQAGRALADPQALDCDVILVAQVREFPVTNPPAVVATTDVSDLCHLVDARLWPDIVP